MLCTQCKKNQATIYYRQNINGKKSEQALCRACFEKMKAAGREGDFEDLLGSLFAADNRTALRGNTVKACTLCGSTWNELCSSGKVGCAKCYEVFRDELASTVNSIHGRRTHAGRRPGGKTEVHDQKHKIKQLKKELDEAVKAQNFEDAARLRDEIRAMEDAQ